MKSKKELKDAFRQMTFRKGVYQIRNTVNNKVWVHHSEDLDRAWNSQYAQLSAGSHPNRALQRDWNNSGKEHFVYEVIEVLSEPVAPFTDIKKEIMTLYRLCLEELMPYGDKGYHQH